MARETKVLTGGIYFGEGPRWRDGRLWFSDFQAHAVKSVSLAGDLRTEFEIDDQPSGLGWMPDGTLLVVSMTKRQVLKRTPDGKMSLHADLSGLATWHCNDMVVDAKGRAYVGNFGFDLDGELEKRGIESVLAEHGTAKMALIQPDGAVSVAAEDLHFPNGTMITPDGKTLVVGESLSGAMIAFDVAADGTLSNRRTWATILPAVPDGACMDAEGAIWVANPIAHACIRVAEGGEILETIDPGDNCYACMLGGPDGKTLFMLTAETSIAHVTAAEPKGKLVIATVDVPHAGRP
jgi:sugar lactone lactonase YvrE